jgi:preprotein translocase subunit SecB
MHPSPLQLEHYFVTDLHFSFNRAFDGNKAMELKFENLAVQSAFLQDDKDASKWQVTLKVIHQPAVTVNSPYSFSVEIVGLFHVLPAYHHDKELLVKTNGPSMLYGIAREYVRSFTSIGFNNYVIVLPSVSFFEPAQKPASPAPATPAPTQPQAAG